MTPEQMAAIERVEADLPAYRRRGEEGRDSPFWASDIEIVCALARQTSGHAEIEAPYKRGWNDREADFIERAEAVAPIALAEEGAVDPNDPPCTDCDDTGVNFQTERACTCSTGMDNYRKSFTHSHCSAGCEKSAAELRCAKCGAAWVECSEEVCS